MWACGHIVSDNRIVAAIGEGIPLICNELCNTSIKPSNQHLYKHLCPLELLTNHNNRCSFDILYWILLTYFPVYSVIVYLLLSQNWRLLLKTINWKTWIDFPVCEAVLQRLVTEEVRRRIINGISSSSLLFICGCEQGDGVWWAMMTQKPGY